MVKVRVGDDVFDSTIALQGPARSRSRRVTCTVTQQRRLPARPRGWDLVAGTEDLWIGRTSEWTVSCLDGIADVAVAHDGCRIVVRPHDDLSPATLSHIVLDIAVPLRLAVIGRTVLHATAVAVGNNAIGFAAPSGTGKSAMALSWCASGASLIADDCLEVRRRSDGVLVAIPTYPGSRARLDVVDQLATTSGGDAGAGKQFVTPGAMASQPVRLAALVLLRAVGSSDPVAVQPLGALAAFEALRAQLFFADMGSCDARQTTVARLAEMVDSVAVLELHVPRALSRLSESRQALLDALGLSRENDRVESPAA